MKKTIIFDLDGTLVDTPSGIVETFTAVLKSMNIAPNPSAIKTTIGIPLEIAFSKLLGVDVSNGLVAYAISQYQLLFKEIVLPKAKKLLFKGVTNGLPELKAQGFNLAIGTSKFYTSAETLLKASGIWDYFDVVVGADQVTQRKPHPEMGFLVMKKLGTLPEHTLMVGDTTHDILMANDAGMRSIAVTYGVHDLETLKTANPTWTSNTFAEVIDCIEANFSTKQSHTLQDIVTNNQKFKTKGNSYNATFD